MVEAEVVKCQQVRWLAGCFRGLQISLIERLRHVAVIKQNESVPINERDLASHEQWD